MSKQEQFYCKLGQAICNVTGAILFVVIPMLVCNIAGYIANLI